MGIYSAELLRTVLRGARNTHVVSVTFTAQGHSHTGTLNGMGSRLGLTVDGELWEDVHPDEVTHVDVTPRTTTAAIETRAPNPDGAEHGEGS
jgi:hypothetical protein